MSSSVPYPWDKKTVIQHKITLVLKKKTKKLFSNFQVTCITLLLIEIHKLECQTVEKNLPVIPANSKVSFDVMLTM